MIDRLLEKYGESHQNSLNKLIHWICVPLIVFSLAGLVMSIPWPFGHISALKNWSAVLLFLALIYYLRLSISMFFGFIVVVALLLWGNYSFLQSLDHDQSQLAIWSLIIFIVAWIGQFIGHKIEGAKPSFFQDIQFLLIGPAWLMHFIFKRLGIDY